MKALSAKLSRKKREGGLPAVTPEDLQDSQGSRSKVYTSISHPIYADHIPMPENIKGTLGMVLPSLRDHQV